ncbi:oligoendopeptidase F, partial [Planococcus sp. SIMBA_143]
MPVEDTWELEAIYENDQQWEEEFNEIKALLPQMKEYKGKLAESADKLYNALQKQDEITIKLGKLYTYAHMRYDQDTTNSHYQGLN